MVGPLGEDAGEEGRGVGLEEQVVRGGGRGTGCWGRRGVDGQVGGGGGGGATSSKGGDKLEEGRGEIEGEAVVGAVSY